MKLYKLSGRVSPLSILYGTITALILAPILAAGYAYFVVYPQSSSVLLFWRRDWVWF